MQKKEEEKKKNERMKDRVVRRHVNRLIKLLQKKKIYLYIYKLKKTKNAKKKKIRKRAGTPENRGKRRCDRSLINRFLPLFFYILYSLFSFFFLFSRVEQRRPNTLQGNRARILFFSSPISNFTKFPNSRIDEFQNIVSKFPKNLENPRNAKLVNF